MSVLECEKGTKVQAQFFGNFQLVSEKGVLNENNIRSDMVTKLLSYMIYHRRKSSTIQALTEVLWSEDKSDNPAGALKNLMYRLRSILKKEWGPGEFILTGRGCYQWNPEVEVEVDAEEFESYSKAVKQETDRGVRIRKAQEAVDLYKGKILSEYSDEYWIMSLSVYYHSTYLTTVKILAEDLESENRYEEMEEVCQRAVNLEPLDEDLHCFMLRALIGNNKQKLALERFREIEDLLYDSLGVKPSEKLQNLYEEMMKQQHEHEYDIGAIQNELKKDHETKGAFLCEYGIFKKTYELELRRSGRLGLSVFLSLISLYPLKELKRESPEYLKVVNEGMELMEGVLLDSLRFGDVITRYSVNQYLVMLPGCQYENARMVLERVQSKFYSSHRRAKVRIHYSFDEMEIN